MSNNGTLTVKQKKFIDAVIAYPTVTEAAERAGISRRTGDRYLVDPNVKRELAQAQDTALGQTARQITEEANTAIATLRDLHRNPKTPAGIRERAAYHILDLGLRYTELLTLTERVGALEMVVTNNGNKN